MKRLLHTEQTVSGTERWWYHTGDDGKSALTVETVADVEPVLDANKRQYNDAPSKHGDMSKVASIPAVVIEKTVAGCATLWNVSVKDAFAEIINNKTDRANRVWRELLNAREFRYFRTRPGTVDTRAK
jgi:hypothetical protein